MQGGYLKNISRLLSEKKVVFDVKKEQSWKCHGHVYSRKGFETLLLAIMYLVNNSSY